MIRHKNMEITIGMFTMLALTSLLFLIVQTTSFSTDTKGLRYHILADFDDATGLKPKAPVRIAGVKVGEVRSVNLEKDTYFAQVDIIIYDKGFKIPRDSTISILTEGILGSKYAQIKPGFDEKMLHNGDKIAKTYSGIILENLIGQAIGALTNKD
ncbi:MAG: outer membrane lipid asymmetry maintenance protein MlaD [Pseudomonadota bacterium]|nr:outer membrane lipid asymmetry maintenance protein MlaD [Pseudomonadota bacterium]